MTSLSISNPTVGQPDSTEEPKIPSAFTAIQTWANGNIDTVNLSASAGITARQMGAGSAGLAAESFSAYRPVSLTVPQNVATVIPFDTEEWDVSGRYNVSTGRFTPGVAGYYRVSALAQVLGMTPPNEFQIIYLYKNGGAAKTLGTVSVTTNGNVVSVGSVLVSANGSSDYFDIRILHSHGPSLPLLGSAGDCFFQGELIGRS